MYRCIRPLLFTLPPEFAHGVATTTLRLANRAGLLRFFPHASTDPITVMGLAFPNRVGIAAGLDKNASCVDALGALGVGFVEVGTITPRPQSGNAKPRLFRLVEDQALINRMGFPNRGAQVIAERLRRRRSSVICGVNIGKNASTPLDMAADDYVECLRAVYRCADYVAINISSPNTAELRRLQHGELLKRLLDRLVFERASLQSESGRWIPMLVKVTADLDEEELVSASRTAVSSGMDGVIATNTTVRRDGLRSPVRLESGGLSGAPLLAHALRAVGCIRAEVGASFPIVGVGGVTCGKDAAAMRAAGADLVQIYTGLVYRGPRLIRELVAASTSV